jgi:hypothetical protein
VSVPIPSGLSEHSRRLWRRVTREFVPPPGELLIFEQLLRTADELAHLQKLSDDVIACGEEFYVTESRCVRPHPVFDQLVVRRKQLEQLATRLDLPHLVGDLGGDPPAKPSNLATVRAQKKAG